MGKDFISQGTGRAENGYFKAETGVFDVVNSVSSRTEFIGIYRHFSFFRCAYQNPRSLVFQRLGGFAK